MFGAKVAMGFMFAFLLLTLLSDTLEGAWAGAHYQSILEELTQYTVGVSSWWSFPKTFSNLFLRLPDLVSWNYSWLAALGPAGQTIRWVLGGTTMFGLAWGFAMMALPYAWQLLASIGRGLTGLVTRL